MKKPTYYELHKEEIKARVVKWAKDNPERRREISLKNLRPLWGTENTSKQARYIKQEGDINV